MEHLDPHVAERLKEYVIPEPGHAETERLIAAIRPLMPRGPQPVAAPARFRSYGLERPGVSLFRTLLPQLRLFHPLWWVLSLLTLAAGMALELPPAALAPVLVVAGLVYSLRTLRGGGLELELACPVTPAQAVLARMIVVLGYYLVLGGAAALLLPASAALFLSWCAALAFFAGLMLACTLLAETTIAAVISLAIWAAQLVLPETRLILFSAPGPVQVATLAVGLMLLGYVLWGARPGRLLGRGGE